MGQLKRRALLATFAAAIGCAGGPGPRARTEEVQTAPVEVSAPMFASPARWHYHPAPPEIADTWIRLPDGGCAITAEGGQRWIITPIKGSLSGGSAQRERRGQPPLPAPGPAGPAAKAPPCSGKAQAASVLAPEELTGIVRRPSGSWLFAGASGALYESGSALGPFTRTILPPEPLAAFTGAGSTILGATLHGKLLRWTEADGWSRVPSMIAHVVDVAAAEGGRAIAVAVPEALFTSEDGGVTWKPSTFEPIGAHHVGLTAAGDLAAQGLTESVTWDPRQATPFTSGAAPIAERRLDLDVSILPAPSTSAITYRRAAIDGDRYYEVSHRDDADEGWILARGKLEGPIESKPIPATDDCGSMKLGASGKQVVTACVRAMDDGIIARIRRSDDSGETWSEPLTLETLDTDSVNIAVAPDGAALITGVCKQTETLGSCKPGAPLLVRPEDRRRLLVTGSEAPALGGAAGLPAFSIDGRSAYFLGLRLKDERLTLFVSHDGGETFSERPLGQSEAPRASSDDSNDSRSDNGDDDNGEARRQGFDINEESSLSPGEDGTVGMVLVGDRGITYVTTDDDGHVIRAAAPPASGAIISGFGRRVVGVSVAESDAAPESDPVRVWESLDGGASWSDVPGTRALTRDFFRSTPVIACGGGGCLFGETVARIGWAGQVDASSEPAIKSLPTSEPSLRAPIVCELAASTRWTRIDHVVGSGWGAPDINESVRGRAVWSLLTYDRQTGAVAVVAAMLPSESAAGATTASSSSTGEGAARVTTRSLLGRAPQGSKMALKLARQMEGYAAARVRFAIDAKDRVKLGVPMRGVEVAWENWNDGTSGRVTLPDAGPFELGDIKTEAGDLYDAALLSVSLKGIFVQPHSPSSRSSATYFLEPGGKVQRFEYPTWPESGFGRSLSIQSETVLADDQLLAVGMEPWSNQLSFSTVLIARRTADAWAISKTAVAPQPLEATDLLIDTNWTYSGRSIGVTAIVTDPKRNRGWATFQPFRGDGSLGPAAPLPTPFDVADPPRACSAAERSTTARLEVSPFLRGEAAFPGTRRPVLITEPPAAAAAAAAASRGSSGSSDASANASRGAALLTSGMVLHGTPSSPCVAAWDADPLGPLPDPKSAGQLAALIPGDLTHAWLFRSAAQETSQPPRGAPVAEATPTVGPRTRSIEYRPMTCRLDPSAKIPEAAWSEPGTTRLSPAR